ncbi:NAD(P)-dependent oxidoreductase [Salinibacter ruber]|uniref:D-3-phosphoglycerate dehydrogenase n=1 Tax=Salinibacter ruber TaxID=146919 RepID=A0A9X2TJ31_9BACT|nr:NAD(P)-dependent oxidoreductase [Salinibacter ruber]MCS3662064.1 D-3-phosphoglycerate dehydrogenase [Salinibacter ruber]MCS3711881.1 D-3-phosphoglycerate dehydrogenase [Salinibacter ruber]
MAHKVLISAPYMQPEVDRFRPVFDEYGIEVFVPQVEERLEEEELLEWIEDIDGVICGDDRFTERVLDAAPNLEVIAKWGTGIDSIDQEACRERGVAVCNTPDAFSEPVADTVLGYILCFARNLPWMDKAMKDGVWKKIDGFALREATLGVVGVGDVGKTVVQRAEAFGMRVLGNDRVDLPSTFLQTHEVEMVDKPTLFRESDFVSLNTDLNETSRHLVDAQVLSQMKDDAILINASRGPVVDEEALVEALRAGEIRGAALDVFEREPLPEDSPLRSMDNVMLAPHNANSSPEAWEFVHRNTVQNLLRELVGEAPDHDHLQSMT